MFIFIIKIIKTECLKCINDRKIFRLSIIVYFILYLRTYTNLGLFYIFICNNNFKYRTKNYYNINNIKFITKENLKINYQVSIFIFLYICDKINNNVTS